MEIQNKCKEMPDFRDKIYAFEQLSLIEEQSFVESSFHELQPLKEDIQAIQAEQKRINLMIENDIRSDIRLLAENYVPAAKKYEKEKRQAIKQTAKQTAIKMIERGFSSEDIAFVVSGYSVEMVEQLRRELA